MSRSKAQVAQQVRIWSIGMLMSIVIGSCSVAYAYSGEQLPKSPTTPLVLALAASFGAR
jgi:hypothetical protein